MRIGATLPRQPNGNQHANEHQYKYLILLDLSVYEG
jgi:hypothetical protein